MIDFSLENNVLNTDTPIIDSDLAFFVQEIDVVFASKTYEMLSDTSIGKVAVEDALYKKSIRAVSIQQSAETDINNNTYGSKMFSYTVDVKFIHAVPHDAIVIDVIIHRKNEPDFVRNYIFK